MLEECLAYLTGGSSRGVKGVEAGPMVAAFAIVGDWLAAEVLRQVPIWVKAEKLERMLHYLSGGQTSAAAAAPAVIAVLATIADWLE